MRQQAGSSGIDRGLDQVIQPRDRHVWQQSANRNRIDVDILPDGLPRITTVPLPCVENLPDPL